MPCLLYCWQCLGEFGCVHCQSKYSIYETSWILPNRTKLSKEVKEFLWGYVVAKVVLVDHSQSLVGFLNFQSVGSEEKGDD